MKTIKITILIVLLLLGRLYHASAQSGSQEPVPPRPTEWGSPTNTQVPLLAEGKRLYLPIIFLPARDNPLVWYDFEGDFLNSGIVTDRSETGMMPR